MIMQVFKEDGFMGFFKGVFPSLLLTLSPLIQFALYEPIKSAFTDKSGHIQNHYIILATIVSKLVSTVTTYPLISIRTLIQAKNKEDSDLSGYEIITGILNKDGILGFFKGNYIIITC